VVILASVVMDDSKDRSPPFKVIDYEFLGFSEVGSQWRVFSIDLQINPNPGFYPFARIPLTHDF